MNNQELTRVLQVPVVSEKSTLIVDRYSTYVFKVRKTSDKQSIKKAIELMFNVQVDSVRVLNVKGKVKRFGRFIGARSDWKKAYVKLKPGFTIDFSPA